MTVTAILECLITLGGKRANLKTVLGYKATSNHALDSWELLRQFGRLWTKNETVSIKCPHPEDRKEVGSFYNLFTKNRAA